MSFLSKIKIKTKILISPVALVLLLVLLVPTVIYNVTLQYKIISQYSKVGLSASRDFFVLLKEIQYNHYRFDRFVKLSKQVDISNNNQNDDYQRIENEKVKFENHASSFVSDFNNLVQKYSMGHRYNDDILAVNKNIKKYKAAFQTVLLNISKDKKTLAVYLNVLNHHYTALKKDMENLILSIQIKTQVSIDDIRTKSAMQIKIFLVLLGIAIFFTVFMGLFFSTYLTQPILNLSKTIKTITQKGDYSQRAKKESECEIGTLVDGFNQMLFEIERTEKSLIESREYFQTIIESLNQMLIVTNEKGLIKEINKKAMSVLGYSSKKDIKNKFIEHVLGKGQSSDFIPVSLNDLLTQDMSKFSKKTYLTANQKTMNVMFSSSIIKNATGSVTGVICISYPV